MKRGQSQLSCLLALDKPIGASSHDLVNVARRVLSERRIGHSGTLDPFASGVLLLMAGPAARLDKYLVGHDKSYEATIVFGASTTTDDCTGEVLQTLSPHDLENPHFTKEILTSFTGQFMQLPPVYSAIKHDGKKSYDSARRGNIVKLDPRPVEVMQADLIGLGKLGEKLSHEIKQQAVKSARSGLVDERLFENYESLPYWKVKFQVSKGTYIRALARDIGIKAECPAHLGMLRRTSLGQIDIVDCLSRDSFEAEWRRACIDPVFALGYKVLFTEGAQDQDVLNGKYIEPFEDQFLCIAHGKSSCECLPPFVQSTKPLRDGELVSIISGNTLKAIYAYDSKRGLLLPDCVFNIGVSRGFIA